MSRRTCLLALVAMATALLTPGQVSASDPSPDPSSPTVWLKGAFGRVPGGAVGEPATAAPDGRPLDTWMRRAPFELTADLPAGHAVSMTVVARPVEAGKVELLSDGAGSFVGPDAPGRHVVVATLEIPGEVATEHAWLVDVPDRSGSLELLWDIPGPVALLGTGEGVRGVPGHGCYAYLCVEAGLRPPPATLEPVRLAVGATPVLRIDDGSALLHWQGRLEPVDRPGTQPSAAAATLQAPQATTSLVGLEPTDTGEWLLEVRVDYDRERGWQWFLFRLLAE